MGILIAIGSFVVMASSTFWFQAQAFAEDQLVSRDEIEPLRKRYQQSQTQSVLALEHQHDVEIFELETSQKARISELKKTHQQELHDYFLLNTDKRRRKAYVELQRQKELDAKVKFEKEIEQRKLAQALDRRRLLDLQKIKLQQFEEYLNQSKRPPENLW